MMMMEDQTLEILIMMTFMMCKMMVMIITILMIILVITIIILPLRSFLGGPDFGGPVADGNIRVLNSVECGGEIFSLR